MNIFPPGTRVRILARASGTPAQFVGRMGTVVWFDVHDDMVLVRVDRRASEGIQALGHEWWYHRTRLRWYRARPGPRPKPSGIYNEAAMRLEVRDAARPRKTRWDAWLRLLRGGRFPKGMGS